MSKDARYKEVKKLIQDNVKDYRNFLNLDEWKVEVLYMDEYCDHNEMVAMDMTIDISYLRATMKVYPKAWEDCDDLYLKQVLVHELCHIITEPQYSLCRANVNPHLHVFVEEQREQETERIARIACKGLKL